MNSRDSGPRIVNRDSLRVLCWCEANPVWVSAERVRQCKTNSCGQPYCSEEEFIRQGGQVRGEVLHKG